MAQPTSLSHGSEKGLSMLQFEVKEVFVWIGGGIVGIFIWILSGVFSAYIDAGKAYFNRVLVQIEALTKSNTELNCTLGAFMAESAAKHVALEKRVERLERKT
jgi:hypothetical protein